MLANPAGVASNWIFLVPMSFVTVNVVEAVARKLAEVVYGSA